MHKTDSSIATNNGPLTYLALGDSYTIAESVEQFSSFPYQLAAMLNEQGLKVTTPRIVAKTGWTTVELREAIKMAELDPPYGIITLLIGVNNQYRGNSQALYRTEFRELLQMAIAFAGGDKSHVFVLSIPDWGITPFGKHSGRAAEHIAQEINAFNAINKEETINAGAGYTDITPDSRRADTDDSLIASDGLHPSADMYKNWVKLLSPGILKVYQ